MKSVPGTATLIIDKHQPQILAFPSSAKSKTFFPPEDWLDERFALSFPSTLSSSSIPFFLHPLSSITSKMSDEINGTGERFAIGISFGNSSSSIARINPVCWPAILALSSRQLGRCSLKMTLHTGRQG